MKTYNLEINDQITKEVVYEATGLCRLQSSHLSSTVRVETPEGGISMDNRRWFEYDEKKILTDAIALAKQWLSAWQTQPGLSFVITSGAIASERILSQSGDDWRSIGPYLFTGFGNGKTTIAEALLFSTSQPTHAGEAHAHLGPDVCHHFLETE